MGIKQTLSAGLHNIISDSPPKTDRLLSLFLITVISLMAAAMLLVFSSGLKSDLENNYIESSQRNAESITRQIDDFFSVRILQLQAQAKHPILQQGIMQPDDSKGLVEDFLGSYSIIGQDYGQVVLDFKGDQVFHNNSYTNIAPIKRKMNTDTMFGNLYEGKKSYDLRLDTHKRYWTISVPIRYSNHVEGALLTYVPVQEMAQKIELSALTDLGLELISGTEQALNWGAKEKASLIDLPILDGQLTAKFGLNFTSLDALFANARLRIIISLFLIAIAAIAFAILIGRWFFVRPIERLHVFATELSEGADPKLSETKRITVELQSLSNQFIDMGKKIRKRERDLIHTNEELKRNQDSLVHSEKMAGLGQVTAGVAHEINNPVGFIMNNLSMLQEYHQFLKKLSEHLVMLKDAVSSNQQSEYPKILAQIEATLATEDLAFVSNDITCLVEESLEGAERVKGIIQGLKGYAYSGENVSGVNINDCVDSTLKVIWNELKYNCEIEKELHDLPLISCVGGHINQVLMNLFINAAHAMRENGGKLGIKTYKGNQNIHIEISDTGHGIEPKHLKSIFDPFFTTKPVGEGTGLGMSICYDIIKQYNGDIKVASTVGKGTTFHIRLPIVEISSDK